MPRSILLLIFLLFSITNLLAQPKEQLPPDLDKYIQKVLQTFEVPGVAVGIVKNGKTILAKGYGIKKLGHPEPVDK
ncbi:MAG: serine hydrolase, partial [Chitinophagaceae bacterium]|nr:serine hydrolase [Chitinophagaceae bacterium]